MLVRSVGIQIVVIDRSGEKEGWLISQGGFPGAKADCPQHWPIQPSFDELFHLLNYFCFYLALLLLCLLLSLVFLLFTFHTEERQSQL